MQLCAVRLCQLLAEAGSFGFQIQTLFFVFVGKLQKPFIRNLTADVVLVL